MQRCVFGGLQGGGFYDVFHDEQSPSGSIFTSNEKNGHQLYKCHSESNPFLGNIFEVVKELTGFQSQLQVRGFLVDLYKIEIVLSELDMKLKEKLTRFKGIFESSQAELMYPNMFTVLNKYGLVPHIQLMFNYAIEYIGIYKGRAILYLRLKAL